MKTIDIDLLEDVVSSYDQTKTTIQGKVFQKVINSENVLGPPLTKFIDYFSDTGFTPYGAIRITVNDRLFICGGTGTGGSITVTCYDIDPTLGTHTYVGKLNFSLPNTAATTHTIRFFTVEDNAGVTGWKIVVGTSASVLINGGVFVANSIDKADFQIGTTPTIPFATGNGQKAIYFVQNPAAMGVLQAETALLGGVLSVSTNRVFTHNGTSAVHQYYVRDTTAALTWTSASTTITVASPGKVQYVSHPFLANDPVVFVSGTLPTGLNLNQVYFVRNPGTDDFELSATTGGASINTTGSPGTADIGRAFGTTSDMWVYKTGNLPALTGTLLATNSENRAIPVNAPVNGGILNGNECAFFCTSSNLYLGLLTELTSGATTWPSLTTSNLLGATSEVVAPVVSFAVWSDQLDAAVFATTNYVLTIKQVVNNAIQAQINIGGNVYFEGNTFDTIDLGLASIVAMFQRKGWLYILGGTVGQRVVLAAHLQSDSVLDYSYIVTKVVDKPNSILKAYATIEELYEFTSNTAIQYRCSGFGSISGGWIDIPEGVHLDSLVVGDQIQFKILFNLQSEGSSTPAQIHNLFITIDPAEDISDNWEYSFDNTDSGVPTRVGFRLRQAYASAIPTMYFRAFDTSGSLLLNHNTVTNAANFEYSTDDGASWLPLGTIPNTVGTLLRYSFTSPPGVKIRPGIKES